MRLQFVLYAHATRNHGMTLRLYGVRPLLLPHVAAAPFGSPHDVAVHFGYPHFAADLFGSPHVAAAPRASLRTQTGTTLFLFFSHRVR